jgi:hypothetical protein
MMDRCGSRRSMILVPRSSFGLCRRTVLVVAAVREQRMQLIVQGEGGLLELPQLMRNCVEFEQSTPCFLVSITLECYDKWKHEREISVIGE